MRTPTAARLGGRGSHQEGQQCPCHDKKEKKPRPDFSNVPSGGSSTAPAPGPGEPETSATSATTGRTYVVVSDSLSKIAKHQYGDAQKWSRIYEANRNIIKDPDLIYPGQELRIPEA